MASSNPPTRDISVAYKPWDTLTSSEIFWRDHYNFLKDRGYTLRPRYRPDWVPSWLSTPESWSDFEDGVVNPSGVIMDASRPDGSVVVLKPVDIDYADEIDIGKLFSSEPFSSNTRNHCVPILDVIDGMEGSKRKLIVMPLLYKTEETPFETIGEMIEYFRQIFEGLHYMHENKITHGDCKYNNIMADTLSLFDSPPHPFKPFMKRDYTGFVSRPISRTKMPVKYYLLDFDLAKVYKSEDAPYLKKPPWGGDKTVPEHLIPGHPLCDPFPVDVYCIGNIIRQYFLGGLPRKPARKGLEFMYELVSDMVQEDPKKRPSMSEVVSRFDDIIKGLSGWKLRSPVIIVGKKQGITRSISHWTKQSFYVALRLPPIPRFNAKDRV